MGKSIDCALDTLKRKKMRNNRKKRRCQQRALLRAASENIAQKVAESILQHKVLTEKYCAKWRKAAKEARYLRERLDATKREPCNSKQVRWSNCTFVYLLIWSVSFTL